MNDKIISYDLGTGGNKASIYDIDGNCMARTFVPYRTYYTELGWHEQCPLDWWNAVKESTKKLLKLKTINRKEIKCLAISGHSLGVVPIDKNGLLLREKTPIWSDNRAYQEAGEFFKKIDEENWYMITGNGFPPELYTIFKIMWYKYNEYDLYKQIYKVIGTKDYINYKLTGQIKTDYSYASGSGVYDLKAWKYSEKLIKAIGIPREIFPEIIPSTQILGELTKSASKALDLPINVKVVCGGVDNSCMAVGAGNISEGRVYTSLGSSAWIAVSSKKPLLDFKTKPFVFTHVVPKMFTSAVSIFSAGSSYKWIRDNICKNLVNIARKEKKDSYLLMDFLAEKSPIGSKKLIFNPSLSGGSSFEADSHIRGGYFGLDLIHDQSDLIRSVMEGVAINLSVVLEILRKYCKLSNEMIIVGGGSKSKLWRQIFADTYNSNIIQTNIGQEAGSLGAAAIAAVGVGLWKDFSKIDEINQFNEVLKPIPENVDKYKKIIKIFKRASKHYAQLGNMLYELDI